MADLYDLERFVVAQDRVFERVLRELEAGEKKSHWMWFVFPQLLGLGTSPMARRFGIDSLDEARAYLGHPILGPRLLHCTRLVLAVEGRAILTILGSPDDVKFRSCMTLFGRADPAEPLFGRALTRYYGGVVDPATMRILADAGHADETEAGS